MLHLTPFILNGVKKKGCKKISWGEQHFRRNDIRFSEVVLVTISSNASLYQCSLLKKHFLNLDILCIKRNVDENKKTEEKTKATLNVCLWIVEYI